jgi:acetyl esterase/lipase
MNRQGFLRLLSGAVASLAAPGAGLSQQKLRSTTYTYKVADGCEIKADVHSTDAPGKKPVAFWIHGGALVTGNRAGEHRDLVQAGFVVVTIDYRLAPITKLPAIIEDVQDAYQWVVSKGPELFHADPERITVGGSSAGGYLTLMTGFCVHPRPKALVSYFGYGDITAPWISRPDPHAPKQPRVTREEAYADNGDQAITEFKGPRQLFNTYVLQTGAWPKEISGHDPDKEPRWFDRYCPVRNVSKEYPPTLLIHGTNDVSVPCEQSKLMAEKLGEFGVEHELILVPGAGHGLKGADPKEYERIRAHVVDFLKSHVSA